MKTTGRLAALALVLALPLGACTGDDGGPDGDTGTRTPSPTPSDVVIEPGDSGVYRYANAGLTVTLDLAAKTLEVQNGTGRNLPKPDFYVLRNMDGSRVEGRVIAAGPVADGETATFGIALSDVGADEICLVVLLIGRDNYGAFVEQ